MSNKEAIVNVWFVFNKSGYIYALYGKAYIAEGTDQQMMDFLRHLAPTDYFTAQPFPLPQGFETVMVGLDGEKTVPAVRIEALQFLGGYPALFRDVYVELDAKIPLRGTGLKVPARPLMCITPLLDDGTGKLTPLTANPQDL